MQQCRLISFSFFVVFLRQSRKRRWRGKKSSFRERERRLVARTLVSLIRASKEKRKKKKKMVVVGRRRERESERAKALHAINSLAVPATLERGKNDELSCPIKEPKSGLPFLPKSGDLSSSTSSSWLLLLLPASPTNNLLSRLLQQRQQLQNSPRFDVLCYLSKNV